MRRRPLARRLADRREAGGDVADQVDLRRPVGAELVRRRVEADQLRLLAEAGAEAEAEVERHADHQGDVGAPQPGAAGAAEGQLVVGGQAAAAQAVEEDRDPERLGQRPQLVLAPAPVEPGAGHDRRALGRGEQRRGLLDALRRLRLARRGRRRDLRLRLGEDDVERVVDEGRPGGRGERQVERRRGARPRSVPAP